MRRAGLHRNFESCASLARCILGLIVSASFSVSAQSVAKTEGSQVGTETNSLRLTIAQKGSGANFSVELHNEGTQALILNVGMMLANGRQQYADRIQLHLRDPNRGLLHLDRIGLGGIAGRMDPMVVPLPPGATFALGIDLTQYGAPKEKDWQLNLSPGHYMLQAEYTGIGVSQRTTNLDMAGIALMPFWTGHVQSANLPFTLP